MKFKLQKFIELTGQSQRAIASYLNVAPSNVSRFITGQRNMTVPQILQLQQLDKKAWEQCVEKDILDKLQSANMNLELWDTLTDGMPTKTSIQFHENKYITMLKENEGEIESLRNQVAALETALRICSEKIAFKDEMIERLMKIIEKQVVS